MEKKCLVVNFERKLSRSIMKTTIKITSFLLLISICSFNCSSSKITMPHWLVQHREKRLTQFEGENKRLDKQNYIILLGDSITEGFPMEIYFSDKTVLNRGIVADHTGIEGNGILQRLKVSVFDCRTSKVFLMIGINDLADKIFTPRQIAYGVKLIIQKIRTFDPQIKVYLQSVLPTTGKYAYLNDLIVEYNQLLQEIAEELKIDFIDLHPQYSIHAAQLKIEYSRDGLHLNSKGYQLWYKLILPFISVESSY